MDLSLTPAQLSQYRRDGYCLLENLVSRPEIDAILARMEAYVREQRPRPDGFVLQVEPRVARGEVKADPSNPMASVRKIVGPVPGDDLLTQLVTKPRLVGAMQSIMGPNLKLFRADFLMKPPQVGSAKGVHQDSPYWPIEPYELASCWIAFDDATLTNGCMQVIPGSHRQALPHVAVTDDFVIPETHYDKAKLMPVEMAAGTGLVFHSLLIHGTAPNTSARARRAITISVMPAEARYTGATPKPEYFRLSGVDVPGGV